MTPSLIPESAHLNRAKDLLDAGLAANERGDPVTAERLYRDGLELLADKWDKPESRHRAHLHAQLGIVLAGTGRLEEAVGEAGQAFTLTVLHDLPERFDALEILYDLFGEMGRDRFLSVWTQRRLNPGALDVALANFHHFRPLSRRRRVVRWLRNGASRMLYRIHLPRREISTHAIQDPRQAEVLGVYVPGFHPSVVAHAEVPPDVIAWHEAAHRRLSERTTFGQYLTALSLVSQQSSERQRVEIAPALAGAMASCWVTQEGLASILQLSYCYDTGQSALGDRVRATLPLSYLAAAQVILPRLEVLRGEPQERRIHLALSLVLATAALSIPLQDSLSRTRRLPSAIVTEHLEHLKPDTRLQALATRAAAHKILALEEMSALQTLTLEALVDPQHAAAMAIEAVAMTLCRRAKVAFGAPYPSTEPILKKFRGRSTRLNGTTGFHQLPKGANPNPFRSAVVGQTERTINLPLLIHNVIKQLVYVTRDFGESLPHIVCEVGGIVRGYVVVLTRSPLKPVQAFLEVSPLVRRSKY